MEKELADNRSYLKVIYLISVLIPLLVAFLIFFPNKLSFVGDWVKILPGIHATINSITAFILIGALVAIKKERMSLHRSLMFSALIMGILFLVSYIIYHSSVDSVKFGDINHDGLVDEIELVKVSSSRMIYLGVLASHIILSILVVPFVLFAFYYALTGQITKHKRMVKYTYPVWLYVSITGVIVYFMISPYYL
jgi:putative membrane protein